MNGHEKAQEAQNQNLLLRDARGKYFQRYQRGANVVVGFGELLFGVIALIFYISEVAKQKCRAPNRRNLQRTYEPKLNGNLVVYPSELRKE